ncbi:MULTISPECIES: hypothetical protein [Prauserella salsuginis group]|uniref:Uncharacterized protein n=2 Tax=Prauserella salsuginis group TaxID=2893672 RepID=A0A839XT36_9PSEU|nr:MULTISPECIES: hypothetical protein [Prauserella salsuginis group]MBB3664168.1 hypothetical protein [Prauserella sediminis]
MGGDAVPQWRFDWHRENLRSTPTRVVFHAHRESVVYPRGGHATP